MFISAQSESRGSLLRPLAWPSARALSHWLWYGRSLRAQLLIVFMLIDVIAGLIAGAVTILQARTSTRIEIAASMELAELLVSEAVGLMQQEVPAEKFLFDLTSRLRLGRHVRIGVKDAQGSALAVPPSVGNADATRGERAPGWFAALIAAPIASRDVPVVVNGARIGSVEIVAEPRDEIAEVWGNTVALGAVAVIVNIAVIAILYFLFGRVLDPLTGVARGLADLEQRNYRVRLPRPRAQELAAITDRFNALAQALDAARSENEKLNHRLITAQDDERRRTALELHDEVGPGDQGPRPCAEAARRGRPDPVRPQGQCRLDRDGGGRAAGAGGAQDDRARARHAGDHRAPAEHQSQHAQPAAPDGAGTRAVARHPRRAGAGARPAASGDRVRVFRPQAHARLRRFGRSHGLSLRAGKPDQRHPPRAGKACRRGARRSGKRGKRERRTGACAHRA